MTGKRFILNAFGLVAAALLVGCAAARPEITQVNTIDSLLAGVYDGAMTLGELKTHGDFGIGTFDRLDGEMLLDRGVVYQIRADGQVYLPDDRVRTPFAAVTWFAPDRTLAVKGPYSYAELCALIDRAAPNQNSFAAIRITGDFAAVHTRSVPAQSKPYRPLAEVTKTQPEFHLSHLRGTVVGFRLPAYVKGINVPGYHLHFLSADLRQGGHILGLQLNSGTVEIGEISRFRMILPEPDGAFAAVDLSRDRGRELHAVESAIE
jgi:acetolactate decarboxylase